jgi:HK97 gp10 family phage protein
MSKYIKEWRQREFLAKVSGEVAANLYEAAEFAAGKACQYAPKRTGRLIKGIHVVIEMTARNNVIEAIVGVHKRVFWAYWQEVGTKRHPAHSFLRPAIFGHKKEILRIVSGKK